MIMKLQPQTAWLPGAFPHQANRYLMHAVWPDFHLQSLAQGGSAQLWAHSLIFKSTGITSFQKWRCVRLSVCNVCWLVEAVAKKKKKVKPICTNITQQTELKSRCKAANLHLWDCVWKKAVGKHVLQHHWRRQKSTFHVWQYQFGRFYGCHFLFEIQSTFCMWQKNKYFINNHLSKYKRQTVCAFFCRGSFVHLTQVRLLFSSLARNQ